MEPEFKSLAIRPAESNDMPAIHAVAETTWRATYAGLIPNADIDRFLAGAYALANLKRTLERLGTGLMVAAVKSAVVGYAMAGVNRSSQAELFAIYVLPEWQRHGIGGQLWSEAVAHLHGQRFEQACLWVLSDNIPARRFYERQGARYITERSVTIGESQIQEAGYEFNLTG